MEEVPGTKETLFLPTCSQQPENRHLLLPEGQGEPMWPEEMGFVRPMPLRSVGRWHLPPPHLLSTSSKSTWASSTFKKLLEADSFCSLVQQRPKHDGSFQIHLQTAEPTLSPSIQSSQQMLSTWPKSLLLGFLQEPSLRSTSGAVHWERSVPTQAMKDCIVHNNKTGQKQVPAMINSVSDETSLLTTVDHSYHLSPRRAMPGSPPSCLFPPPVLTSVSIWDHSKTASTQVLSLIDNCCCSHGCQNESNS